MRAKNLAPLLQLVLVVCSGRLPGSQAVLPSGVEMGATSFLDPLWELGHQPYEAAFRQGRGTIPTVTVGGATFVGTQTLSASNRILNAFLGIQYATVPKRFRYSELVTDYGTGEVPAASFGPVCSQVVNGGATTAGAEQCLSLDVYIPADLQASGDPLPVMVFVHGGSFINGKSSSYLPTRLLDEDVILVVIQYRLGALGWLALQCDHAPGNAALSDQLNALRWVKRNIASFHGAPQRVTVLGESAGAATVSLLVTVADPAEDLFQRAITESGSALEYWAIDERPLTSAGELAELCSCRHTHTAEAIYACLIRKTAEEITMCTYSYVKKQRREQPTSGFHGTTPVVQENVANPIISMLPINYIEQRLTNDVPLLSGCNRDEGSFAFALITDNFLTPNGLKDDGDYLANSLIPASLSAAGVDDSPRVFTQAMKEKFFPGVNLSSYDEIAPGMVDMTGMLYFKSGTYNYATFHSRYTTSNSYLYSFDFEGDASLFDYPYIGQEPPFYGGVTHGDELMYLFSMPVTMSDEMLLTSRRMVRLWTNFAKFGDPTPDGGYGDLGLVVWEPLTDDGHNFLLIQDAVTLEEYYPDRFTIRMDSLNPPKMTSSDEQGGSKLQN